MKKTLVALAALAATSAFAQSSVTISGSLDYAAVNNAKVTTTAANGTSTVETDKQTSQLNSWTTNQLSISGVEDLGGGTKASFTINSGVTGGTTGTLGSRDQFLALENAKMGKVQLGRFIAASASGYHPLSGSTTAVGGLYGMLGSSEAAHVRHGAVAQFSAGSFERGDNKIQYSSANMNGFTFNVNYSSALDDTSATTQQVKTVQSGVGLNYANGPLTVGFGTNTRKLDTAESATTNKEGKLSWLGASYDLGMATVYATNVSRKDTTTTIATGAEANNFDAKVNQIGVKVPMGQYTFGATTYTGKDKRGVAATDDMKLSGNQLYVQYAMSKRTSFYALTGVNKITRDSTDGDNRKQTLTMVGVAHTF